MNSFWKTLYIGTVVIELGVMSFYGYTVYRKKQIEKNVLGVTSVNPIKKENLIFPPDAKLKYFYESKPNTEEKDQRGWLPYTATYTINSDSLNERFDYSIEKQQNVFRIITLGDSFTFGHCVNTTDNWPEQLENSLNTKLKCKNIQKFEVINLGGAGYDIEYIVHRYKIRGMKYQPNLILWLESGTGFIRYYEEMNQLAEMCEATKSADISQLELNDGDPYNEYACWNLSESETMKKNDGIIGMNKLNVFWDNFYRSKGNTPFVYMLFSYIEDNHIAKAKKWTDNKLNTMLYTGIPNIYEKNGTLPDWHPNAKGHKIIANDVFQYLLKNNIIPCESSLPENLQ